MAAFQQSFKSYRIVWTINERRHSGKTLRNSVPFSLSNKSEWWIQMQRTHLDDGACYSVALNQHNKVNTEIIRSSFYLLTPRKNHKFGKITMFETDQSPIISIFDEKIFVCAFDVCVDTASNESSEIWSETKSEELTGCIFRPIATTVGSQLCTIKFNDGTDQTIKLELKRPDVGKPIIKINTTGLKKDQQLDVALNYINYKRCSHLVWVAIDLAEDYELKTEIVDSIEVRSKAYDFRKMEKNSISKIAERIFKSFSDSLMSKYSKEVQKLESVQNFKENSSVVLPITNKLKLDTKNEDMISPLTRETCLGCTTPSITPSAMSTAKAKQLLSTIEQFFTDKTCCDIKIQLDGGQQIRAHRFILASGSTVWRQLITNDGQLSTLLVPNLDIEIIEAMITFIYTGTISKPPTAIQDLFIAADTYGVDDLKIWCEQRLHNTITIDSAINLLVLAHKYNAKELFEKGLNFFRQNVTELTLRDEWKSVFCAYPEVAMEIFSKITNNIK